MGIFVRREVLSALKGVHFELLAGCASDHGEGLPGESDLDSSYHGFHDAEAQLKGDSGASLDGLFMDSMWTS